MNERLVLTNQNLKLIYREIPYNEILWWMFEDKFHDEINTNIEVVYIHELNNSTIPYMEIKIKGTYETLGLKPISVEERKRIDKLVVEPSHISLAAYMWLIKNHYDVFELIEKGFAIDINKKATDESV